MHAEAGIVEPHHLAFETAETVHIEHHLGARHRHEFAGDRGAARRQIADLAARFLAVGGREKTSRQLDAHAPEAPAFGARLRMGSPSVITSAKP